VAERRASTTRPKPGEATPPPSGRHDVYVLLASFLNGAAVLVLEILGTRVISPYYGASIYVWSSLIGVTLAALAIGYWAGGWVADRRPPLAAFAVETTAAALVVILIPAMRKAVLAGTTPLGLRAGSLTSAAILFGPPLVLLSMTGPAAIRLVTREFTLLGRGVGTVYGVSTFGSMLGALGTGFVLVPSFSVRAILLGVALALLVVGATGMFLSGRPTSAVASIVSSVALGTVFMGLPAPPSNLVALVNSFYGEMKVLDVQDQRILLINGIDNGFVDKQTLEPVAAYLSYVTYLPRARPEARRALCIGLGVGTVPRALRLRYGMQVDAVEIDPQIVALARRYFGLPAEVNVAVEDGRTYVERTDARYGFVVLDAFRSETHPVHLFTREFFASVDRILEPGGILAINLVAFPYGEHTATWRSVYRTVAERFRFVRMFIVGDVRPEEAQQRANIWLFASREALPDPASLAPSEPKEKETLTAMSARELSPTGEGGFLLTDDYNPMDDLQRELFVAWRDDVIAHGQSVLLFDGTR
jgi:spermidine synthase